MTSSTINPYKDRLSLSTLEAEVLWEYAKLNQHVKDLNERLLLVAQTRTLDKTHEGITLEQLRVLERKISNFKASVWGVMSDRSFSTHPQDDSIANIL
ncbi:hypothetical protein EDB92DRAFT_1824917 [Lactarius akahatsu]|uniref:DASH complex subunit DAD3 n=1 Tax=Lactarius akahatsu TaxID=416441 RepID=A0AAD4LSN7_9AGAM|nr:hypothetical protein EDB92DRAFT_1824917 [Lactarius akahatsu]